MTVATDTIGGAYLVEGQAQKEARSNEWFDQLALNLAGYLSKDVSGAGTVTLTSTIGGEAHHAVLVFTGTLTGTRIIEIPAATRSYLVRNATTGAFTLTVKTAAGAGVAVAQGTWAALVCDGTDVLAALTSTGGITPGTALSVVRYAASGTALEASPLTIDASGALTALATNIQPIMTWSAEHTTTTGGLIVEVYQPGTGSGSLTFRKATGTRAAPGRVTTVGAGAGNFTGAVWARDAANTADGWQFLGRLNVLVESVDAQGRVGGTLTVLTAPGVSAAIVEVARFTQAGNLLLGLTTHGTSLSKGLALASGTAPSGSHPGDAVQAWAADRGATAGKASLHVRTEDGTSHVLGDVVGVGTLAAATLGSGASYQALTVNGSTLYVGQSSVQERAQALIAPSWVVSTDATRTARLTLSVYDATAAREGLRIEADGSAARLGFYGGSAVAKPTVSGSRGGNAALASALTALASLGLITDSSTA